MTPAKLARIRRTLETAPTGSRKLLDAVVATMDTLTDRQFAAAMRKREEFHKPNGKTLLFEARLRAKLRPLDEPKRRRATMAGKAKKYTVPREPERRVA